MLSTFGANGTTSSPGHIVSLGNGTGRAVAASFHVSAGGVLDRGEVALTVTPQSASSFAPVIVRLHADDGATPGAALAEAKVLAYLAPDVPGQVHTPISFDFDTTEYLRPQATYWISVESGDVTSPPGIVWLTSPLGGTTAQASRWSPGTTWTPDGQAVAGAFRLFVHDPISTSYCGPAVANSTGAPAELAVVGSPFLGGTDTTLVATGLPLDTLGYFLVSRTQGFVAAPAGSSGNLCLGGSIGRFNAPGQIQQAKHGQLVLEIDLFALPSPNGPVIGQLGDTWNFQAWFRDANPSPTSNFTNGASLDVL